jgi:hypothetical protein
MQTTTIEDIEVIYESKTHARITIKGNPDAICEVLQKINDNQIKLNN